MKHIKSMLIGWLMLITGIFNSCNFLDVSDYFDDTMALDSVFANKYNLERYMYGIAGQLPHEGDIFRASYTPGLCASDELLSIYRPDINNGTQFITGEVTEHNIPGALNQWNNYYRIIRRANTLLARMDEAYDMTVTDKIYFLGYSYFLRAYAYYHIVLDYGPAVLAGDELLENNEEPEYYYRARATYDETIDYVCQEFERAAEYLPDVKTVSPANFGRPSKEAALALIARLRIYQASPAFNGGAPARQYFSDWTRSTDGVHYISQEYNEKKWAVAAAACKRIIDSGMFELHRVTKQTDSWEIPANVSSENFPYGAGDIDTYRSYSDMFTGETVPTRNPELIWGCYSNTSNGIEAINKAAFDNLILKGWNNCSVPQHIIDNFYMADGQDKNNSSKEYPYSEEYGFSTGQQTFSGYVLNTGVHNMYLNREMRFYATIGYSERYWPLSSTSESQYNGYTISYHYGSHSGKDAATTTDVDHYPMSGYVLTKYAHESDAYTGTGAGVIAKYYQIIRYADILLYYVEALNNLTQPHEITLDDGSVHTVSRNIEDMKFYFNQIRFRCGLPGLTNAEVANTEQMQSLIERERMIEFLGENRRYYDIRRWGYYVDIEKSVLQGMDMDSGKEGFYNVVSINHPYARARVSDRKLMFLPIHKNEIRRNHLCDQNPGYGS